MKLAYLASATIPSNGADAVHVMNVCKAFANQGLGVTLYGVKSESDINSFDYYDIPRDLFKIVLVKRPKIRILGGFIFGFNVKKAFNKNEKPDFIYARSIHSLRIVNPNDIPFIFESHWKPHNFIYSRWQKHFIKKKNLASFVFISNGLRKIYNNIFPNNEDKFVVLHDACNKPVLNEKVINERLQIGYVGSFFKGNGHDIIPEIAKLMPECDFHIVGGSGQLLSEYKTVYNSLKNLIFLGHVPYKDLADYYARFDVMLAPYQKYLPHIDWVSPMKLFEYMSYVKPIIASDFPVIREVVNENNSILVTSDSIVEWQNAIEKMKNEKFRDQLGNNAYKIFEGKYTWDYRVKEIIKIFNQHEKDT